MSKRDDEAALAGGGDLGEAQQPRGPDIAPARRASQPHPGDIKAVQEEPPPVRFSSPALAQWLRFVSAGALLTAVVAFFYPAFEQAARSSTSLAKKVAEVSRSERGTFYLNIRSDVPGASVYVDGVLQGTTPILLDYGCERGADVSIEVRPRSGEPVGATARCVPGRSFEFAPRFD